MIWYAVKFGFSSIQFFNEIAQGAMKSYLRSDEICCADEIKSVLSSNEVGFHHEMISSIADRFIPSARTDLVEKTPHLSATNVGSFHGGATFSMVEYCPLGGRFSREVWISSGGIWSMLSGLLLAFTIIVKWSSYRYTEWTKVLISARFLLMSSIGISQT